MRVARSIGWVALFGIGMACGGDSGGGNEPGTTVTRSAGEAQTGEVETQLEDSIRVLVSEDGAPQAGVTVTWSAQGAGASVDPATSVTDAGGLAATTWTLGTTSCPVTARATVDGASPLTFHATATGGEGVTFGNTFFRSNHNCTDDAAVDTIGVGESITWTGTTGSHTVRSQGAPSFTDSGTLNGAATYTVTFNNAGTYQYDCEIHGGDMTGRVVVLP